MDVNDVRIRRQQLEFAVLDLIKAFEEDTLLTVDSLMLSRIEITNMNDPVPVTRPNFVRVEVSL